VYAEGQRRLLASMSTYAKRFVGQLKKPDVDFVNGLSPVVSIDQKTVGSNPRSTVGTMTDISDYLRMLFATVGTPHCPMCDEALVIRTSHQMMEHVLSLPKGTEVEVRAPVYKIYGEDYDYLFEQIRVNGYRRARIDGEPHDLGEHIQLEEDQPHTIEAVIDGPAIDSSRARCRRSSSPSTIPRAPARPVAASAPRCACIRPSSFPIRDGH
jgi:excinuclease ABC subunit A